MNNHPTYDNLLKPGSKVPNLQGVDQEGRILNLGDLLGKKVIIFFYPKDDTPTCTKEACNLRDNYTLWKQKGYEVIGISPDKPRSHQKFIQKFDLPYTLIADTDHTWLKTFGVWGPKQMFGRDYMGIHRTTFVLDKAGVVEYVVYPVVSATHTQQLLEMIEGKV